MDKRIDHEKTIDDQRLGVISALIALSIAALAILHSDNTILGLAIQPGSFIETVVNAIKLIVFIFERCIRNYFSVNYWISIWV